MIELFEQQIKTLDRQSSKGMQLKWRDKEYWYKSDYAGYEGLAEYLVSSLLTKSDLILDEFSLYSLEEIRYRKTVMNGCKVQNFLPTNWQMITLERLFKNYLGEGLNACIYRIPEEKERLRFIVEQTERFTDLKNFGMYMSKIITIDALFLNEERHSHNIAVLLDDQGIFHLCPIFDNGAALLSDSTMDYPLHEEWLESIKHVKSKTFHRDFDVQLDIAEHLYGTNLHFEFTKKDVVDLLKNVELYPQDVKERVMNVILYQMDKYAYLFK